MEEAEVAEEVVVDVLAEEVAGVVVVVPLVGVEVDLLVEDAVEGIEKGMRVILDIILCATHT